MAIKKTGFRGNVLIAGRPKEQAKAEIMLMKAEGRQKHFKQKRAFFLIINALAVIALALAIYSFYKGEVKKGFTNLLVAVIILVFLTSHHMLLAKRAKENKKK